MIQNNNPDTVLWKNKVLTSLEQRNASSVFGSVIVPTQAFAVNRAWLGFTLSIALFMILIHTLLPGLLDRLFSWRISSDLEIAEKNRSAGSPLHKFMDQVGKMHADAHAAFLTALPSVDIVDWIDKNSNRVRDHKKALEIVDLEKASDRSDILESKSNAPVLLTNLAIDLHNLSVLVSKMNVVEAVLEQKRNAVFVHSNLSIGQLLLHISARSVLNVKNGGDSRWMDLVLRTERLFGEMRAYIIPMTPKPFQPLIPLACHFEFAYGTNAEKALDMVTSEDWESIDVTEDRARMRESIILKAQQHLKPFYLSIWSALDKKERYVVYDICEDGFINIANKVTVYLLVEKGILRLQNESILPFNESFRNFVLTNIRPEEALEIEQLARSKGSWGAIRLALMLSALALVTFLFLINQSSLDKAVAVITGGVTLFGLAGRLFSSFSIGGIGGMFNKGKS